VQAKNVYHEGMKDIQYTIRGVPKNLDRRLREEARESGRSINRVVIETLQQAKLPGSPPYDDLDWFVGSGESDDQEAEALDWLDSLPVDAPH
jgi:hypothetical protein